MEPKGHIDQLSRELLRHQYLYYVKNRPEISDAEYDRLFDELAALEEKHPRLAWTNSPTKRVGSDLDNSFPERRHSIPVLSLDKAYAVAEAAKWMEKVRAAAGREIGFNVEEKIDGASIVLYYDRGELQYALTRGSGFSGNDVTENVRTIRQVPLRIAAAGGLAVRGEIYLTRPDFERLNVGMEIPYANPRNLAAGTLRNLRSAVVAKVPLQIFVYEGHLQERELDHLEMLCLLYDLGFRLNPGCGFFSDDAAAVNRWRGRLPGLFAGALADFPAFAQKKAAERRSLDYEIDGLVLKVDQVALRQELGNTAHHPRWAVALKFDSPQAVTRLRGVTVQIGRNGRVTPVAELDPVRISGSTVSRATLHNQDYIDLLELGIGDSVSISKRGDVIPAVEKVIEKDPDRPSIYRIRADCPFCRTPFVRVGAHLFCPNENCPERRQRALAHFAGKDQMDIETLGWRTIVFLYDKGYVREIPELYTFDYNRLLGEEGFKEKKIAKIRSNLEKSKSKPFAVVLTALGFEGLGTKAAETLIDSGFTSIDKMIAAAVKNDLEAFSQIAGIGPVTAGLLVRHFSDPKNLSLIEKLRKLGLKFSMSAAPKKKRISDAFAGQAWVITGTFQNFQPRAKAAEEIEKNGGKVMNAVTARTTHLLVGENPGSKLVKAQKLGVKIVSEPEFLKLLKK